MAQRRAGSAVPPQPAWLRRVHRLQGGWQDYWRWTLERNGRPAVADGRYLTDVLTAEAVDFVDRHRRGPFYLQLAYNAPHYPFQAPQPDVEEFLSRAALTRAVATIYAMLRIADRGVGRIMQHLDDLGLADNTIVMFTSDNGPQLDGTGEDSTVRYNAGLHGAKQTVFEGGIRVPMILRWPAGLPGRQVVHDLAHFTDWLPTLLSAAGVPRPPVKLDGTDLLPVLRGERGVVDTTRFWQWNRYEPIRRCNAAMRDGDWKLVWPSWPGPLNATAADLAVDDDIKYRPDHYAEADHSALPTHPPRPLSWDPLLFNLGTDPLEQTDLAATQPARVRSMTDSIDRWFHEVETERRSGGSSWLQADETAANVV